VLVLPDGGDLVRARHNLRQLSERTLIMQNSTLVSEEKNGDARDASELLQTEHRSLDEAYLAAKNDRELP
jgi:hypothetical protein